MIYLAALGFLSGLGGVLAVLLLVADRFLANYGPCTIRVNDEEPFTLDGGCTLLDALYQQKIFIPSACGGQGTCGFCKVDVLEGAGPLLPTELPYLSEEEIGAGTRLACRVKVKQDVVVHVRPDYLNIQEFSADVTAAHMVTHDTREIVLKLIEPAEMVFMPGQYVQVIVPDCSEPTFRAYSVSSPPSLKQEIELLVRLIPGGVGSTYLHGVEVGEAVTLTGPYGEFVLDEDPGTALICVGGGCGLAPMRSLLRHICEVAPDKACWLFFGARTEDDVMYEEELAALQRRLPNLEVHVALSEPGRATAWTGETGFIHESVARHLGTEGRRQAFLCGPPLMIEATMKVLEEKGVAREKVFYDEF
jgi:Na+-transporting NADH:ubiquinone oxidoreductase subunit F